MNILNERHYKDDLTGKQFGELTVLEPDNSKVWHSKHWLCKCSCGKIVSVERKHLLDGSTKSCGHTKRQNGLDHTDNFNGMRDRQNKYNTNLEVIRNQKMQPNNTSGVKGVDYHKGRDEWRARVYVGGKEITKWFKNKEDAIKWREQAVGKYYKPKIDSAIKAGDLKEDISQKEYKDFEKKMQEDTLNKVLTNFKHCQISDSPQGGSEYILFDGRFLSLGSPITHLQFEDYMERIYKISLSYLPSGIQVNDSKYEPIIRLSITKRPNKSEYYAIEEWLDHLYNSKRKTNILDLTLLKEPIANYAKKSINLLDYDKEDIIQIIKDYFRYGCIVENLKEAYHYGNLDYGKKAETRNQFGTKRGTGHFGTGFYSVGKYEPEKVPSPYNTRDCWEIDLDKYNLFKPKSNSEAHNLHDALKYINEYVDRNSFVNYDEQKLLQELSDLEYYKDNQGIIDFIKKYDSASLDEEETPDFNLLYNIKNRRFGAVEEYAKDLCRDMARSGDYLDYAVDILNRIFKLDREELKELIRDAYFSKSTDSVSTNFMKALGYEGVDVTHLPQLDNFSYGSVVYDLKPDTYRKVK